MEDDLIKEIENLSINKINDESTQEKKGLKKKIRELENVIQTRIIQLQTELNESKQKEKAFSYDFSDLMVEFKEDVKKKIDETSETLMKKIDEQNKKHLKLFNLLVSLKNEFNSINKSISVLTERIRILEEEIGD